MTEDQLREQMRQVDELTSPDTGFEAKVLYAGQRRLARRRSWTSVLVGAAAAVVVGGVVINLGHSDVGTSSSVAGAAPEQRQSSPEAPGLSSDNGKEAPGQSAGPDSGPGLVPEKSPTTLPPTGVIREFDWQSSGSTAALAKARATLSAPPYDVVYTGMALDEQALPVALHVYLTAFDAAAMRVVTDAFPAGAPITFVQSAYSAKACAATLETVNADLPTLERQGFPITTVTCSGETGRVDIALGAIATAGQRASLATKYGGVVNITG